MRGYPKVLWQKRVTNYKRLKKRFKRIVKMFEQLDYNRVRSLDNEKLLQWMKWTNKNLKWTEDFFVGKLVNMILLQLTFSLIAYCTRDIGSCFFGYNVSNYNNFSFCYVEGKRSTGDKLYYFV